MLQAGDTFSQAYMLREDIQLLYTNTNLSHSLRTY